MLFLHRTGELEPAEARSLAAHLAECKRCAEIAASLERADHVIGPARRMAPRLGDPDRMSARIMRAIDRDSRSSTPGLDRILDRLAAFLDRPPVRFAAASFVCTVTVAFLIQQATLFLSLWELEQRVASKSAARPAAVLAYTVERKDVERLEELRPALQGILPVPREGRAFVISADALRSYESMLRGLAAPLPGSPAGATINRKTLEHLYETLKGSLSLSVMFQSSEG
jgi:hypothetical protein